MPAVVAVIFGMLFLMFKSLRPATAVFLLVPLAATGGMLGLLGRGMPFSLPAAVGFIALGGVSVLNGVVIATAIEQERKKGLALEEAVARGAAHSIRAVLTTAAVAGLGFLPMALSTSAGSEVQRPLATVVIVGIFLSTGLTLLVLPGLLFVAYKGEPAAEPTDGRDETDTGQYTPTSPLGFRGRSTPQGTPEEPFNPISLMLASGARFVARSTTRKMPHLSGIIGQALRHKGFSFVDVLQICATYFNVSELYDRQGYELSGHDPADFQAACRKAEEWNYNTDAPIAFGLFYQEKKPCFEDRFSRHPPSFGGREEQIRAFLETKR
ncbi:MAG TPA: efflux RND transporter permease subunit [Methanoregulaceae archaeon]|nr:efflux RND transporter permease subunit [Methanoregulaceae archaeon]